MFWKNDADYHLSFINIWMYSFVTYEIFSIRSLLVFGFMIWRACQWFVHVDATTKIIRQINERKNYIYSNITASHTEAFAHTCTRKWSAYQFTWSSCHNRLSTICFERGEITNKLFDIELFRGLCTRLYIRPGIDKQYIAEISRILPVEICTRSDCV